MQLPWFTQREKCPNTYFSGRNFPVFGLNTEKYVPEKTPYLDSFYSVNDINHNMKIKWNNDKNKFSEL